MAVCAYSAGIDMTQDEIIEMARQAGLPEAIIEMTPIAFETFAKLVAAKAIAELESQEPVAWLLTDKNINSLQVDSIQRLIDRLKHAHHTDLCVRINGQDEWFQADWLKHMVRVTPPQRTEQEPEAWMYQEYRDDDQFGWRDEIQFVQPPNDPNYFRNIVPVYTTPPQRTWVGLTDDEFNELYDRYVPITCYALLIEKVEAKLKDKNT